MAKLTVFMDEEVLRRARIRALEQGTSLDAVVSQMLEAYASGRGDPAAAAADLLALSRASTARRGEATWSRDELHERH